MAADPNSPAAQAALAAAGWTPEQYWTQRLTGQGGAQAPLSPIEKLMEQGGFSQQTAEEMYLAQQMADPRYWQQFGLGPEEAALAARNSSLTTAGLPSAYVSKLLGLGGGAGAAGPRPQNEIDPRNGELVRIHPDGTIERTGQQLGFAGVDPREEYGEKVRQFDNSFGQNEAGQADAANQWRTTLGENAAQFRAGFAEDASQWRSNQDEMARQADNRASMDEFQTRAGLVPELGNLALGAASEARQIFSEGGDYMARAYGQANQQSPLGEITQATLLSRLMGDLDRVTGLSQEKLRQNKYTGAPGFSGMAGFQAPDPYQGFSGRATAGLSAPPAFGGGNYGSGGVGGGGGAPVAAAATVAGGGEATPVTNFTPPTFNPANTVTADPKPTGPTRAQAGIPEPKTTSAADSYIRRAQQPKWAGTLNPFDDIAAIPGILGRTLNPNKYKTAGDIFGFEDGSMGTHEPAFITGEDGYELNVRMPDGSVAVLPHEITKQIVAENGKVKGFEDGTGFHAQRTMDAVPADFWGHLQSVLSGTMEGFEGGMRDLNADISANPTNYVGFGGVGGGLRGLMGKAGPQVIKPELAKAALAEMRAGDLARRYAMQAEAPKIPGFASGTFSDWNGQDAAGAISSFNQRQQAPATAPAFGGGAFAPPYQQPRHGGGQEFDAGWQAAPGYTAQPDSVIGVSQSYVPGKGWVRADAKPPPTQEELGQMAYDLAPPRVRNVFDGKMPAAPMIGAGLGSEWRAPTFRQLSSMNKDDLAALGTLVNVKSSGKTTLDDLMYQANAVAQPQFGGPTGRVRGLGL